MYAYALIDGLKYNNTLLVHPDPLGMSIRVKCIAMIGGVNYNQYIILHRMIMINNPFICIFT